MWGDRLVKSREAIVYIRTNEVNHYNDVIMGVIASQIITLTSVYSTVYSGVDQRKHQCSESLAFVWGPVNSPHKWQVTRKMFPFDDVIMIMASDAMNHAVYDREIIWL